jgi:hypothetical protein
VKALEMVSLTSFNDLDIFLRIRKKLKKKPKTKLKSNKSNEHSASINIEGRGRFEPEIEMMDNGEDLVEDLRENEETEEEELVDER